MATDHHQANVGLDPAALIPQLVPGPSPRRQLAVFVLGLVAVFVLVVQPSEGFGDWHNDWRHTGTLSGEIRAVDGPLELRSQAATVALADGRVLIWGGRAVSPDSANVYDPVTDTWEHLPAAPGPARFAAAAVWTGDEAIIWGGSTNGQGFDYDPGGVAWRPATRSWRSLPPAPVGLHGARAVAFETGVLFAGGAQRSLSNGPVSLWLDLGRNEWTLVPTPVTVVHTAWDGDELLATGPDALTMGRQGRTGWPVMTFDPERLAWEHVAEPIDTEWMTLAIAGDGALTAVTLEGLNAPLRAYEWTGQEWNQVAETARGAEGIVTISVMAFPPAAIWTGQQLIVGGEGALTSWDPSGRRFATRSDQRLRSLAGTPVWTGAKVVALSNQSVEGWVFTPGRT